MPVKEATTAARCDRNEIIRAVNAITAIGRGGVTELRALNATINGERWRGNYGGYYNDAEALVEGVAALTSWEGVYVIPNTVKPEALARAVNRIRRLGKDEATADNAIEARRFLLIDCDWDRIKGISATNEQHDAALERARVIHADSFEWGWPDGIIADSGNGGHLVYAIDGVATLADDELIKRCLEALQAEYGDKDKKAVKVDTSVFNPSRIWKLYGTLAGKGDDTTDRPHRMARILHLPEDFGKVHVTREQLEALAAKAPSPQQPGPKAAANGHHNGNGHAGVFNLEGFISQYLPEAQGPEAYDGGQRWILRVCPFNPEHSRGEAFVIRRASGVLQAGCRHESCKWKWDDLRRAFDPKQQRTAQQPDWVPDDSGDYAEPAPEPNVKAPFQFEWLTSAELADCDEQIEYLIDNVVTKAQGGIISGVFKTLKTGVAVDLFTSLATGTPFLGYFKVPQALPCGLMSAEIGKAGLRERARQVADAKGYDPHDIALYWSIGCPNVANLEHTDALQRFIEEKQLAMLGIDPSYLAFCEVGDKASNYIAMGKLLVGLTRLIDKTGCTIILVNHNRHGRGTLTKFAPPELGEISFAGFAEWARFWMLLGARQEWDEEAGQHWLWLRTGGSAGHAGLHHLNVTEGKRHDHGGRRWQAEVLPTAEGNRRAEEERDATREAKVKEKLDRDIERVVRAMGKYPAGETKNIIRETCGLKAGQVSAALAELLLRGDAEPCQIVKGNQKTPKDGYRLCDQK